MTKKTTAFCSLGLDRRRRNLLRWSRQYRKSRQRKSKPENNDRRNSRASQRPKRNHGKSPSAPPPLPPMRTIPSLRSDVAPDIVVSPQTISQMGYRSKRGGNPTILPRPGRNWGTILLNQSERSQEALPKEEIVRHQSRYHLMPQKSLSHLRTRL